MFLSSDKTKKNYRCVVYTRTSDQEKSEISPFDTIEAQRQKCEDYIGLHEENGWTLVPTRYDDRNVSGGTLVRPAFRRLLADARLGKFDMIVVKAIDRFTRSLKHFYEIWEELQKLGIELASATQEFNTASSTGRLHLDIVLRFAQYERELASERTRDKMQFRASKGLFHGGSIPLGFDLHPTEKGVLKPNQEEIPLARLIFRKYVEIQSGNLVATYCNKNGYTTKIWKTKSGVHRGGKKFTEVMIMNMLKSLYYIGRTGTHEKSFPAQWKGIINTKLFSRVQQIIKSNTVHRTSISQNIHQLLLTGLIWCGHCGSQMTHNSSIKGGKKYLYYQCTKVGHADRTACEIRRVSARTLEQLVIDRISFLSEREGLIQKIVKQAIKISKQKLTSLRTERKRIVAQLTKIERQAQPWLKAYGRKRFSLIEEQLKPLEEQKIVLEKKLNEMDEEIAQEQQKIIDPQAISRNFKYFKMVFTQLTFEKQRDLLHLLIKKIVYHKEPSKLKIQFYNLPEIKKPPKQSGKTGSGGFSLSSRFDERMYWLPRVP
ncbi:MAG: recombinase family protein [Candidatus Omnitrophica bacterium]|nr:recombinase family protein [Candidatus Omnitrophota bacterium]